MFETILSVILTEPVLGIIKVVIILFGVILPGASACVYFERKISAWIQNRIGPNRVGPLGLLQPIADVIKLLFKEDIIPTAVDKRYHFMAPLISITIAVSVFAVIPFGHYLMIGGEKVYLAVAQNVNVGILYVLAMTSVGVYGITLAGWSSNNKYSLLGGLRSASQMISYELAMGLSLVGVLMVAGTLDLNEIINGNPEKVFVNGQGGMWNVVYQPLGFIIFLIASFAETNRTPFDLPEAEPELVGGYHTEYSGMKFGIFFLAEYANMIAASAIMVALYFGGWHVPVLGWEIPFAGIQIPSLEALTGIQEGTLLMALIQLGTFTAKVAAFLFFFIWVRWSIPRFRYDQLMRLGWKVLLPLALFNILITGLIMLLVG